jgi:hypothetical protein
MKPGSLPEKNKKTEKKGRGIVFVKYICRFVGKSIEYLINTKLFA